MERFQSLKGINYIYKTCSITGYYSSIFRCFIVIICGIFMFIFLVGMGFMDYFDVLHSVKDIFFLLSFLFRAKNVNDNPVSICFTINKTTCSYRFKQSYFCYDSKLIKFDKDDIYFLILPNIFWCVCICWTWIYILHH